MSKIFNGQDDLSTVCLMGPFYLPQINNGTKFKIQTLYCHHRSHCKRTENFSRVDVENLRFRVKYKILLDDEMKMKRE